MKVRFFNVWYFGGIIGVIIYFVMRPLVDFNSGSSLKETRMSLEYEVNRLANALGMDTEELHYKYEYIQQTGSFTKVKDSLGYAHLTPSVLKKQELPLLQWKVSFYIPHKIPKENDLGDQADLAGTVYFDEWMRLIEFSINTDIAQPSPAVLKGDSLHNAIDDFLKTTMGRSLGAYTLSLGSQERRPSTLPKVEADSGFQFQTWPELTVHLHRKSEVSKGQSRMVLSGYEVALSDSIGYAFLLKEVKSTYDLMPVSTQNNRDELSLNVLLSILTMLTVFLIILINGIRLTLKGLIDWKRGLVSLLLWGTLLLFWNLLATLPDLVINKNWVFFLLVVVVDSVNSFVMGLILALAYITWESLARQQKQPFITVVDAIWHRSLIYKETGQNILHGYALGGVLLGSLAILMYGFDSLYFISDLGGKYTDATSPIPFLTLPINVTIISFSLSLIPVALVQTIVQAWKLPKAIRYGFSVIASGFILSGISFFLGYEGLEFWEKMVLFSILSSFSLFMYHEHGLIATFFGFWVMLFVIYMLPFFSLSSPGNITNAFIFAGIFTFPFILGMIANWSGVSISSFEGYVPEYEERLTRQLRVEKEIEIARESQFELMPRSAPSIKEVDIRGFFIPSFEVGGDYFDYVVMQNGGEEPHSVFITIVDVSGKAMRAAMHAIHTSGLILSRVRSDNPEQVLSAINPVIYQKTDSKTFITGIVAEFDLKQKSIAIANAGHCRPILKRAGKSSFIHTPDPRLPLGLRPSVTYQQLELPLQTGDFVLFYSDGLPEAKSEDGSLFTFDRLLNYMDELDTEHMSSEEVCNKLKKDIQLFSNYSMEDDTTVVCLKVC